MMGEGNTKKNKKGHSIWLQVAMAVCLVVMAVSGYMLYIQLSEYHTGTAAYDQLAKHVDSENTEAGWPTVDFESLQAINPDIVGWLLCEDTVIDYPVVQGQDNSYYLNHLFDGTVNKTGSLFVDYRNTPDFADRNTIIYGHNMKNNTMFSALMGYKDQVYYEKHPHMKLLTPEMNYTIELFAGYVTDDQDDAWEIQFADGEEFMSWIEQLINRSTFSNNVDLTADDHVVTFSTCSYEFEDGRYVLFGKLVSEHDPASMPDR